MVLIFDVVVDMLIVPEIGQVWGRLVQPFPYLHIDPLERLVGLIAIGIAVLINTVVP